MAKKRTKEEFVEKAKKIHGDLYDYSKVVYVSNRIKVVIICKTHGEFEQIPTNHTKQTRAAGCPVCCINNRTKTTEQFIKEAKLIHGDEFDYSLVKYKNNITKVNIVCKIHGMFLQSPSCHLQGKKCPKCYHNRLKLTKEEFIKRATEIHGNLYDYSLVEYVNLETNVNIICKKHKIFLQLPGDHMRGRGCPECCFDKLRMSLVEFIKRATEIHGNLYDYSLVEYVNVGTKIVIICKNHGIFRQTPNNHFSGQGCPKCKQPKNEKWVGEMLNELFGNKTKIYSQKSFDAENLNSREKVYVDYYFELNGKKYIVEYNGIQHYEPIRRGNLSEQERFEIFKYQQTRDEFVRAMCKKQNIVLIEIDGRRIVGKNKIKQFIMNCFERLNLLK